MLKKTYLGSHSIFMDEYLIGGYVSMYFFLLMNLSLETPRFQTTFVEL